MNFRRLDVYQLALQVIADSASMIETPGHSELRDQLRRAAQSVALNIAEATGRTQVQDQRRFFAIARGSAMECAAIVDICRLHGAAKASVLDEVDGRLLSVVRILSKLARERE